MNIIFFNLYGLNGALIDALEYFLYLKSIGCNVQLVLFINDRSCDISYIHKIIDDRYNIDFDYKNDIITKKSKGSIMEYSGNTMMILDWGTFIGIEIIPSLWKNIILWFDYKKGIYDKYKKLDRFDNVRIFKEMSYNYGIDYKFKFAFDLYK